MCIFLYDSKVYNNREKKERKKEREINCKSFMLNNSVISRLDAPVIKVINLNKKIAAYIP